MCIYNTISSNTDHFEWKKRDSEEILLAFVNVFPSMIDTSLTRFSEENIKQLSTKWYTTSQANSNGGKLYPRICPLLLSLNLSK